ncbi:GNAT family N-acetyltransferase [Paraherbaspirillum soli]|uniref:GNAT family N-acetyltransferase n=1 Tax=Paraherbaspirillum soli TaxID=631222 RepID=A0ABW0M7T0_9BURK
MPQPSFPLENARPLPDWQPARLPQRTVLQGANVRLLPIDPQRDAEALYLAACGPGADAHQWDYLSSGPFQGREDFTAWLTSCAASSDPHFFTIVDQQTGLAAGTIAYLAITPEHGSIEIGHVWFSASLQRTRAATETIYLLARHAFEDLGYRRLEWKTNTLNLRSQQAARRFGFTAEGVFRQHRVFRGQNRDTAWFSMLDGEWPAERAVFESWLRPDNFDAAGHQLKSLTEIRADRLTAAA